MHFEFLFFLVLKQEIEYFSMPCYYLALSSHTFDTLLLLCEIYKINDILGTFGYDDSEKIILTRHEKELILQYRKHPEMQEAIQKLLNLS